MTVNPATPATLSWAEDRRVAIGGPGDLDEALNDLARKAESNEHPLIVELVYHNGAVLSIGLGLAESVLNYSQSADPPYYTSVGSEDETKAGFVAYYYYDHWSEFPRHSCVPNDQAREAARRFVQDGKRPANLRWTTD